MRRDDMQNPRPIREIATSFNVMRVANGYLFQVYDQQTDTNTQFVARTPEELRESLEHYAKVRIDAIIATLVQST